MKSTTKQGLQVLNNVQEFLADTEVTTALGAVSALVDTLSGVITRLSAFAVAQEVAARSHAAATRTARERARDLRAGYLRPVAELGKALFPRDPSIRPVVRMPKAGAYVTLLTAATAIADRVGTQKERFVAAGFRDDFVDQVHNAVAALHEVLAERSVHLGNRSAATAGLVDEMARGRDLVRVLDALLVHEWRHAPARLARWRSLSRFPRRAVSKEPVARLPAADGLFVQPVDAHAAGAVVEVGYVSEARETGEVGEAGDRKFFVRAA